MEISKLEEEIDKKQKTLLTELKDNKLNEVDLGDIVATTFSKESTSYTSDNDVLNYLKDNKYTSLYKVKTTESIDKNALKKELKTNTKLKEGLDKFIVTNLTEWVVVTDKENNLKMKEHIEANSREKK